ncbi:MAG: DUF4340 domain-containing protein [Treponema sp.]|nr:DUF4340 domain-containing protein [Treponema sp.]
MRTRKLVLLAGIAVLLCAYIFQTINAHRSPVKSYTLKDSPDTITITSQSNGTVLLTKEYDAWFVGEDKKPASEDEVRYLTTALQSIKTLGVVSRSNSEADLQRYGLDDMSKITITASKGGKELRTLVLGKAAVNADQTYVRVDGGSETLIASCNLHHQFEVKAEDLIAPPPEEPQAEDSQTEPAAPASEA